MSVLSEVVEKYPDYAEQITKAYGVVAFNPERDLEAELSGLGIDEEDIFKMISEIINIRYGG